MSMKKNIVPIIIAVVLITAVIIQMITIFNLNADTEALINKNRKLMAEVKDKDIMIAALSNASIENSPNAEKDPTNEKTKNNPSFSYYVFPYKAGENSYGQQSIQVCILIENTGNTNLNLGSAQIDVENGKGEIVAIENYVTGYPQIIKPEEIGYYYAEIGCSDQDISQELVITPHFNVKKTNIKPIRFEVTNVTLSDESPRIYARGKVTNSTSKNYTSCRVAVILYDENYNVIGIADTVESYNAGETKGFEAVYYSYFGETTADVYDYGVIAYPYQ